MAIGVTAQLEYEFGSGYNVIAGIKSLKVGGFTVDSIDITSLANTNFAKTYEPGMVDSDTISFEAIYSDALYTNLRDLADSRDSTSWRFTGPTGEAVIITVNGFVTKLDIPSVTPTELVMISCEVKCTGLAAIT